MASSTVFGILTVLYGLLWVYIILLVLRITLTWFNPSSETVSRGGYTGLGKAWELLCRITDPYLGLFYRMKFLRRGFFDFTPVAAILALFVIQNFVGQLAARHTITLGIILGFLVSAVWSGLGFLLLFFLVVGVLRTIPILFRQFAHSPIWRAVDLAVQPVVSFVVRTFRLTRMGFTQCLLITLGILFAAWFLGEIFFGQLVLLLRALPV